jgi:hypothetical protein
VKRIAGKLVGAMTQRMKGVRLMVLLIALLVLAPSRASGQSFVGPVCVPEALCMAAGVLVLGASAAVILGGPVWNTVALVSGHRSPLWIRITSIAVGTGLTALGIAGLVEYVDRPYPASNAALAGTALGLGLLNVGLSLWAWMLPEAQAASAPADVAKPTAWLAAGGPSLVGFSAGVRF